jgi:hypothetical protein
MQQRLSNPKLKWWQGILLILGLVAFFVVANLVGSVIAYMAGGDTVYTVASISYWVVGGIVAFGVVRSFIMEYSYSIEGLNFRIDRIYGNMKPRAAETIITRSIVAFGGTDEVGEKYPGAHPRLYTRARNPMQVFAVAYQSGDTVRIAHIQPDEKLAEALRSCVRNNK